MNNNSYMDRFKALAIRGIKIGAKVAFWSSLMYILIFTSYFSITGQPNVGSAVKGFFVFLFVVGFWMFIIGVIPAMVIGVVGGVLFAVVLAFWKKKAPNIWACLMGLILGISLILLANYWYWFNATSSYPYPHSTFLEHLLPINAYDFTTYLLSENWYFIPNIIAFLMSPYLGWKINNVEILDTASPTKE